MISYINLLIFIWLFQGFFLPWVMRILRGHVDRVVQEKINTLNKEAKEEKTEELKQAALEEINSIKAKFGSERFTEYRTKRLGYITHIVGVAEILFFGILVVLLIKNNETLLVSGGYFLRVFGSLLAIKTAINYDQWSHPIAGKAYLYISIIGTFVNIIFAIFLGFAFMELIQ